MKMEMQTEEQDERAKGGSSKREVSKPYILCIFANICFAGFPVVIKVSLDKGMSCYVLVVYGHAFGTLATALLALLFERKNESKISVPIIRNVFFLGLLGGVLGRTLNYMGLEYTSPAIAAAMSNLIPCVTFIIAVLCRMEKFDITKLGTQAKIGGTLISFAGAALMTLYKGIAVISMHTQASHQSATSKSSVDRDWIKGSLFLLVSYISSSAFYILQTITIEMYPAPITLTSITCLSGTLLTAIMAAILDHEASSWKLSWDSTLLAPLYSGVLIFGITIYVQTLVVKTRGPVFMTAFRPLSTIVAAIMGLFVLREAIYLGSILGASLIIVGLSTTLWGENKEKEKNPLKDAISQEWGPHCELLKLPSTRAYICRVLQHIYCKNKLFVWGVNREAQRETLLSSTLSLSLSLSLRNPRLAQDPDFTEEPHGVRACPHRRRRRRHRRSLHLLLPPPSGHHQDEAPDQRRLRHLRKRLRRSPQDLPDQGHLGILQRHLRGHRRLHRLLRHLTSQIMAENDGDSCSVEDEEHTNNNNGCDKEEEELSVPRGGPIFVPNLVGSLTSVPLFQSSIVQELQDLEFEVSSSSSQVLDEDISVDELKILTEEELVDMAIKEAFKDNEDSPNLSPIPEEPSDEGRSKDREASNDEACKKKSRKRKRTKAKNHDLEETYIAKVEHVRRIKEKQDEDKAAVTLHSFNPSSKVNDCAITSSRTIDRMQPLRSASSAVKVKSSSIQGYVPVHYPEVALSIEVYHNARKWVKNQEFLVLGQQTLTELRDKIYCLADHVMQKAKQHDPSGYFLIEDTLCNDLRDPSAVDYSEPIFDWLRNSKDEALKKWEWIAAGGLQTKQKAVVGDVTGSQLPHFRAVDMHKTQFCDLKFRLGAGYLYCHQGDCRHTIVIRDMRLIHPQDVQNRAAYPILLFQLKPHIRKCYVCKIFRATQVTIDDKWAQENPCYFCDNCYYLLHYKDGRLLYDDFSVHEYRHD